MADNYRIYRWKFSRDEIFAKSLKTEFSRLFVCDTSSNIPYQYNIQSVRDYIFVKPVSSVKFAKILSLKNFCLYSVLFQALYFFLQFI